MVIPRILIEKKIIILTHSKNEVDTGVLMSKYNEMCLELLKVNTYTRLVQ